MVTDSSSSSSVAGKSNLVHNPIIPSPDSVIQDVNFHSDQLHTRLSAKRPLLHLSLHRKKRQRNDQAAGRSSPEHSHNDSSQATDTEPIDMPFVQLGDAVVYSAELEEDYSRDVYRWAVLYENQRGITMFSTPYYSPLSLLPMDPPSFTIPSTSKPTRHSQPTVSLTSYPLPDGDWRWVSEAWMVDMRGAGETQYDGFEYNWFFRTRHWRSEVGSLNAGGWVRRRRWVRLMMRPAKTSHRTEASSTAPTPHMLYQNIMHMEHVEAGMTRPPSVASVSGESDGEGADIWRGDAEDDWFRCHSVLRKLGTDGKQLELWRHWLGCQPEDKGKRPQIPQPQWTEDEQHASSETSDDTTSTPLAEVLQDIGFQPDVQRVTAILRNHADDILNLFVFPDSRTHFLEIVTLAGLLPDLNSGLTLSDPSQIFDFYSSSQSLSMLTAQSS